MSESKTTEEQLYQQWGDALAFYAVGWHKAYAHRATMGAPNISQRALKALLRRIKEEGGPNGEMRPPKEEERSRQLRGAAVLETLARSPSSAEFPSDPDWARLMFPNGVAPKANPAPEPTEEDASEGDWEPPAISREKEGRYLYDADTGVYTTLVDSGTVKTTHTQHKRILSLYSSYGAGHTQTELCRILGWSRADVRAYLGAHGVRKNSLPVTSEEIASADSDEDLEDLARHVNAERFRKVAAKAERAHLRSVESDANKWRERAKQTRALVRELAQVEPSADLSTFPAPAPPTPYELIVGVSDPHWGMRSWSHETGYHYDRAEAARRIDAGIAQLLAWVARHGAPTRIIYPFGSDRFHVCLSSTTRAQTTRGTPQHTDGTPLEIFRTGLEHDVRTIERLSQVAPVLLVPCRGNHDDVSGIASLEHFRGRWLNSGRIKVLDTYRKRCALDVGGTFVGFTHGDVGQGGPTSLKRRQADGDWLQREARRERWCGDHLLLVKGHTHHRRTVEEGAVTHVTLGSLAPPDAWHAGETYSGTQAGIDGLVVDGRGLGHRLRFAVEGE